MTGDGDAVATQVTIGTVRPWAFTIPFLARWEARHETLDRALAAVPAFTARAEVADDLALDGGLAGWSAKGVRRHRGKHWLAAKGGMMIAMNRTVTDGRPVEFELLRIEMKRRQASVLPADAHGRLADGIPDRRSRSARVSSSRILAASFAADPAYWRDGEALMARIEGNDQRASRARRSGASSA